jgi:hypothetical protein
LPVARIKIGGSVIRTHNPALLFLRGQLFSRSLAILLAAWVCLLILPEFYRVTGDLSALGLSVNANGVIVDVTAPFSSPSQSPAALAGLRPGDRIDMRKMRCFGVTSPACRSLITVMGYLGELEYTRPYLSTSFDILAGPDATPRHVTLTAAPAPLAWLDRVLLLAGTITGLLFVTVTFLLVWNRPGPMRWGFFLYSLWFNSAQNYTSLALLQPWPLAYLVNQFVEALTEGAACAGLLIFTLRFPSDVLDPSWRRAERAIIWLGITYAVLTAACGLNLFGLPTGQLYRFLFIAGFIIDGTAMAVLLRRLPTLHPQDEQRMFWAIAGCAIGIPAFLLAELFQSTSLPLFLFGATPPPSVPSLLYLLQGAMTYFVGIAIHRRRVVSVVIPLRRGATLTFFTLLLGVPILYLHEQITDYTEKYDLPSWVWPLVLGPIVLLGLARLQDFAAEYTERIFNRRYHRARDILRDAQHAIQKAQSFEEIDRLLTEAPAAALRLASAAVFRMIDSDLHRVGPSIGWCESGVQILDSAQFPALAEQLRGEKPVQLPRSDADRPNLPRDDFFPCLAIPLHGGVMESVAVILCGPHLSGADISHDEGLLLQEFASRAALSYDRVKANELRREIAKLREALNDTNPSG